MDADLAAITQLRRESAQEQDGELTDAGFDERFGSQLLHTVLGYADEHGFVRVVLSPSERSIPFYQRAGFRSARELLVWTADQDARLQADDRWVHEVCPRDRSRPPAQSTGLRTASER